jgi:hypothetical protein
LAFDFLHSKTVGPSAIEQDRELGLGIESDRRGRSGREAEALSSHGFNTEITISCFTSLAVTMHRWISVGECDAKRFLHSTDRIPSTLDEGTARD